MRSFIVLTAATLLALALAPVHAGGNAAAGKEKSAPCAACHGADGNSPSPAFPTIAGQYADYMMKALADYKSGKRNNPIMAGFAAPLTDQDRADLAAYFSSQTSPLYTPHYVER